MKAAITLIVARSIAATAAIAGATFLAYHDKDGWGWLVFVAICIGCVTYSDKD